MIDGVSPLPHNNHNDNDNNIIQGDAPRAGPAPTAGPGGRPAAAAAGPIQLIDRSRQSIAHNNNDNNDNNNDDDNGIGGRTCSCSSGRPGARLTCR